MTLLGYTSGTLHNCIDATGRAGDITARRDRVQQDQRRMAARPPTAGSKAARRHATSRRGATTRAAAATPFAARVQAIVEHELDAVERVLTALSPADAGEAERAARTLASLARALREIALTSEQGAAPDPDDRDDDAIPRDLDEFRRELARRIEAFVDERADGGVPDDAAAGMEPPLRS